MGSIPRFWRENPSRYNLVGVRCDNCGRVFFPPRDICPVCHRESIGKMKRLELSGKGTVYSYTLVQDAHPQFEMLKPYILAMVEMDEGVKITSQIIDVEPEDVHIGMKVEAVMRKLGAEGNSGILHYGYKFRPVNE